jgi:hypothetical protein
VGANDKFWLTSCFDLADLGDQWYPFLSIVPNHASFTHRIIGVADCYLPGKLFEPDSFLFNPPN